MGQVKQLPDLVELKKWGSLDSKSYNEIKNTLTKKNKILVLAPKNSGKNTLQHAIVNHMHRLQKDPFVIPAIEGISTKKFKEQVKLKQFFKMIKDQKSYVATIQYLGSYKTNTDELVKTLLPHFDLIIDMRNIEGKRVVCNLVKGQTRPNIVYTNPDYKNSIAA